MKLTFCAAAVVHCYCLQQWLFRVRAQCYGESVARMARAWVNRRLRSLSRRPP